MERTRSIGLEYRYESSNPSRERLTGEHTDGRTDEWTDAQTVKAHVVFAPSVVALPHVSVSKVLCESSVASQVIAAIGGAFCATHLELLWRGFLFWRGRKFLFLLSLDVLFLFSLDVLHISSRTPAKEQS